MVLLSVYVRNASFGARTGLTTYNVGTSFYIGNGARATGGYVPVLDERGTTEWEETDAREIAERARGRRLSPDEVSRYWLTRTMGEIAENPAGWLRLLVWKAALAVNRIEIVDTDDIYFYEEFSPTLRALNSVWNFGMLLPLGAAGAVLGWRTRRRSRVLLLMAATMFASLIVFYVVSRYRHATAPLLIPFAAHAAAEGAWCLRRGEMRRLIRPAVAGLAVLADQGRHEESFRYSGGPKPAERTRRFFAWRPETCGSRWGNMMKR